MNYDPIILIILAFYYSNVLCVVATRSILEKSKVRWNSLSLGFIFIVVLAPMLDGVKLSEVYLGLRKEELATLFDCGLFLIFFFLLSYCFFRAMFTPLAELLEEEKRQKKGTIYISR